MSSVTRPGPVEAPPEPEVGMSPTNKASISRWIPSTFDQETTASPGLKDTISILPHKVGVVPLGERTLRALEVEESLEEFEVVGAAFSSPTQIQRRSVEEMPTPKEVSAHAS